MFTLCQTRAQVVLIPLAKTLYNHSLYNIRHKDSMFQGFFFFFSIIFPPRLPLFYIKLSMEIIRTVNMKLQKAEDCAV